MYTHSRVIEDRWKRIGRVGEEIKRDGRYTCRDGLTTTNRDDVSNTTIEKRSEKKSVDK